MRAYSFHAGEPADGAALVFAHNYREARNLVYPTVQSWTGCDFTDVSGFWIRDDTWLKENAANREKLEADEPHVVESPPACKHCELWGTALDDNGSCDYCAVIYGDE